VSDPFKTLVAEMMLQRTRSKQVVPVYIRFVSRFPTIQSLAKASPGEVRDVVRPLGLAFRAKTFTALAKSVVDKHGGNIPIQAEEAVKLPGVGPYVATALNAFLGERRLPVIDANVARVISRVFGVGRPDWRFAKVDERRALYEATTLCIGRIKPRVFYYALLDFAATLCTARKPACPDCPMHRAGICSYCATLGSVTGPVTPWSET
jgi:A/G-specific adenine glycosylase